MNALRVALDEAETALHIALSHAKRNTSHLRDARLEIETARQIAAASNRYALNHSWGRRPVSWVDMVTGISRIT